MFDAIAARYDLMNRVMTMGQDQKWRKFVVRKAGDPGSGRVLDLATGTGDIAALSRELYQDCTIVGVLREVHRVLKKGGRVVCLDTTPPAKNIFYPFIQLYFRFGIPLLGRLIAKDENAYAYLTGSTMGFYSAEDLASAFKEAGFSGVGYKKFMLGTIAVHWGIK